tara:strand:+ start:666 stop:2012 length:1347 start_codon:yes stop_codon:yes gene_type:complete
MDEMQLDTLFDDVLFRRFNLPEVFSCHLDLSKSNARDRRDAHSIAEYLRTLTFGNNTVSPSILKKIDFIDCGLQFMDDMAWRLTKTALNNMKFLSIVNIERSRLSESAMVDLLYTLLQLPAMQGEQLMQDRPRTHEAEISIRSNNCYDNMFLLLGSRNGRDLVNDPAKGVRKLILSNNNFSDKAVAFVAVLMPKLKELHLSGNVNYHGQDLCKHVCDKFNPLTLIGLDQTGVDDVGIQSLERGLAKRFSMTSPERIEIWMRMLSVPQDARWTPLLNFCLQPKHRFIVLLKHDMQRCMGHPHRQTVEVHQNVVVRLFVNGWSFVDINHMETLSTVSVNTIANIAVKELNLVCRDEELRAPSRAIAQLRSRYACALSQMSQSPTMAGKCFKVSTAVMKAVNKFTDKTKVISKTGNEILGRPVPGWIALVEVETEEDKEAMLALSVKRMRR